jgi:Tol biopolymer transport system component
MSGRTAGFFNPELWLMNADGSRAHRILEAGSSDGFVWSHQDPAWSPDGRWIAFSSNETGRNELFAVHPDGTGKRQLTPGGPAENVYADWQPLRR